MAGVAVEDDGNRHCGSIVGAVAGARDKVLAFALSLPDAVEEHPWGEDVVKVRGKIFVFVGTAGSRRISVKLAESQAHALAIDGSQPTGYGLGKAGWVTVPLRADGVSIAVLRDWIEESYRIVAPRRLVAELDAS
jgi:predicted DNA-binding protein (MmcQ/YjbR family)